MLDYTRYPDDDFTWFVVKGDTTIDEWLQTVQQYGREGMTRYELYDLRARVTPFTTDEIEQILSQSMQDRLLRPSNGKTAIVVDESLKYGLVRMYDALAELEGLLADTRPFYDMAEAIQWLGISTANIPELVSSGAAHTLIRP